VAVEQGDLLLLPPGLDHVLLDASPDLELFVGALDPALALRVLGQASASFHGVARLEGRTREGTREMLGQLALMRDPASYQARLAELFVQAQKASVPSHVLSRRALDGVRTEPSVSEVTLAQRLRTRPSELSRRFRKDLGVSFVEYRARVRLMRFVDGVDQGRSLGRAARDADFGSYVQCHRVFRRILGCSPTEYFAGTRAAIDALTVPALTVF
jgi:AraC-like DNA-binding protein